jgi:hypothetical protein
MRVGETKVSWFGCRKLQGVIIGSRHNAPGSTPFGDQVTCIKEADVASG